MASAPAAVIPSATRSNPFGGARPVDVTNRDKEVEERIEKEREYSKERITMSRTNSRQASERSPFTASPRTPPAAASPKLASASVPKPALAPSVRPTLSFASAAAARRDAAAAAAERKAEEEKKGGGEVEKVTEKVAEVAI
ncbi:hypothetical protein H0H81_002417 [Sphagnurus paluster]|uniref:Uncharacterized protein n=1 Tax=Sphagnurus paluster TaxID=117069 RepID=A0A9P7FTQ7_9AGAR|nr:hypothetical protein H0H81_002417 [Sphagnurus paluster]